MCSASERLGSPRDRYLLPGCTAPDQGSGSRLRGRLHRWTGARAARSTGLEVSFQGVGLFTAPPFHLLHVAQSGKPRTSIWFCFYSTCSVLFFTSPRFDLILDNVGGETEHWAPSLLQPWGGSKYVTLVTPFIRNTDALGIADGMVKTAASLAASVFKVNSTKQEAQCLPKHKRIFIQLILL